ncbi:MAG: TIGR02594 family protein [Aureispira sp.]|nr:TIGR02594 family protein [Aureispira sp.]
MNPFGELSKLKTLLQNWLKTYDATPTFNDDNLEKKIKTLLALAGKAIKNNDQPAVSLPADISAPVGAGSKSKNKTDDVKAVQTGLNQFGYKLTVDGDCGPKTIGAIRDFQSKHLGSSNPDGRVDPGGRTWTALKKGSSTPAPVDNTPTDNTPVDNTPVDNTPVDNTPTDNGDDDAWKANYVAPVTPSEHKGVKANLNGLTRSVKENDSKNVKADVLAVQYYLNERGYACTVDGNFGKKSGRKMAWFSRSCQDKEVGTRRGVSKGSKLWDYLTGKIPVPPVTVSDDYYDAGDTVTSKKTTLEGLVGSKKDNIKSDVEAVEDLLNQWGDYGLTVNGRWDSLAAVALKDFQAQMGIKADGICGPTTWEYLTGKKKPEPLDADTSGGNDYGPKPSWVKVAEGEIGTREIPDKNSSKVNNPRVLEYHSTSGGYNSDEPAWCASFASWCLTKGGVANPRDPGVIQWKGWGTEIDKNKPFYGCIAIIKSGSSWGHICFVVGADFTPDGKTKALYCLGGNQSNMVRISKYKDITKLICPPGYTPPAKAYNIKPFAGDAEAGGSTR